ncbi:MAG: ISAs1 family transposase [Bacteroidia bacterium]
MSYSISDFFDSLSDARRRQGVRHQFSDVLLIIIMAILSGHQGLRGFTRFAKANESELTSVLKLKYGVPCYYTFRSILTELDEQLLVAQFIRWVKSNLPDSADDFIALDGKSVKASSSGGPTAAQNFVAVVNAFGHRSGLVYGMKSFENGKSGEAAAARRLWRTGFERQSLHHGCLTYAKKRSI